MLLGLALLYLLTTFALILACYRMLRGSRTRIENRLQRLVVEPGHQDETVVFPTHNRRQRGRDTRSGQASSGIEQRLLGLEEHLTRAGLLLRAREFVVICLGVAVLTGTILFLFSGSTVLTLLGAGVGGMAPFAYVNMRKEKRRQAISSQINDLVLLLANSLRAGFSLTQALETVTREMPPPIAEELKLFLKDLLLGIPLEEALNKLERRVDDDDFGMLVTAILIQNHVGGNLAEVLDNISHTIRERVRLKGVVRTLTAQGRMSAIVVSLLPVFVATAIVFLNPGYMTVLVEETLGRMMLGGALTSQLIGIMFIRRVIRIQV